LETIDYRAVLCEPGNVDEFVKAVVRLAGNPKLRAKLGQNARRAALAEYSWSNHVDRLWRFAWSGKGDWPGVETDELQPLVLRQLLFQAAL
jgi:hypothetical protein